MRKSKRDSSIFSFRVFDQDKNPDGGYDSAIDEDREPYYMKLYNKSKHEVCQLRCPQLQPLKNLDHLIVSDLLTQLLLTYVFSFWQKDAQQQLENLGLPLTIEPHDCH